MGADFQSEHERYLEKKFKKPVIITDYPKDIKAFYMRMNDDVETVRAMDVLFLALAKLLVVRKGKNDYMCLKNERNGYS